MALPEIDGFTSDLQRIFAMRFLSEAETLAQRAADCGLVLTIERVNQPSPRMGNHMAAVAVRPDLNSIRQAYEIASIFPPGPVPAPVVTMTTESPDCAGYSRPLSASTTQRIEAGMRRFGLPGTVA